MGKFYTILLILAVLNLSNSSRRDPEIWLKHYSPKLDAKNPDQNQILDETFFRQQTSFQNPFVARNDTEYVVTHNTASVKFICRAAYPVMWIIPERSEVDGTPHQNFGFQTRRVSYFLQTRPINLYHESVISIKITPVYRRIHLTCRGMEDNTSKLALTIRLVNPTGNSGNINHQRKYQTFTRTMDLQGNARIYIEQPKFINPIPNPPPSQIVCCSGIRNKPPEVNFETCNDHLQCQLLLSMMNRLGQRGKVSSEGQRDCSKADIIYNAVVTCKGETMNVSEIYTNVFQDDITPISKRFEEVDKHTKNNGFAMRLQKYEPVTNVKQRQKAVLTIGYPTTRQKYLQNKQRKYLAFLNIPKDDPNYETLYNSNIKPTDSLSTIVAEYPRDFYYEGESIVAICLGWKYFYADGVRIGVLWKNGTRTVIDNQETGIDKEDFMYFSKEVTTRFVDEREMVHGFSKAILANREMAGIECWFPQWNTGKWDIVTKNLKTVSPLYLPTK